MVVFSTIKCAGADSTTINFYNGSYVELIAKAKSDNKAIFIDISTAWCGPCIRMNKEAFQAKSVVDQLNPIFLAYKVDAEKGEGIKIAKQFNVSSYPTLLFLNSSASLMYRVVGYTNISNLLNQITVATNAIKYSEPISKWDDEYSSGNRNPIFLYNYLVKREKLGLLGGEVVDEYIKTQQADSILSKHNLELLSKTVSSSRTKAYDVLINYISKQPIEDKEFYNRSILQLENALLNDRNEAIDKKNDVLFNKYIVRRKELFDLYKEDNKSRQLKVIKFIKMNYYQKTNNLKYYKRFAIPFAEQIMRLNVDSLHKIDSVDFIRFKEEIYLPPDSIRKQTYDAHFYERQHMHSELAAYDLNEIIKTYLQNAKYRNDLEQAIIWSKRVIMLIPDPLYLSINAQLLVKLGILHKAINLQKRAITQAKALGRDTKELERDLKIMRSRKP